MESPTIPSRALPPDPDLAALRQSLDGWSRAAGFDALRVTGAAPGERRADLEAWLAQGFHGDMDWMQRHLDLRLDPALLAPGTVRVISARMNYLPPDARPEAELADGRHGYVSLYARGRDYHKLMRRRLAGIAGQLRAWADRHHYRALVDSAPVLEKPLAESAGLGWLGKHTLLLERGAGSWFFLGEIYTSLPLPIDPPTERGYCGNCRACIDACPTGAIIGPWRIDARRCISYLTIEHKGSIPEELRPLVGNRIFGCDDCQLVCPWNRGAEATAESAFSARPFWQSTPLAELFGWDEPEWQHRTEGSPLRRTGYLRWLRNLAVAMGNAPADAAVRQALDARRDHPDAMVREHVHWALRRQEEKGTSGW